MQSSFSDIHKSGTNMLLFYNIMRVNCYRPRQNVAEKCPKNPVNFVISDLGYS